MSKKVDFTHEERAVIMRYLQTKADKAKPVVYKETTAQGTVDWKAYAMALGGTEEGAEAYRKASNIRTSLDWATKAQEEEINR